tara:strand:- start:270 stop:656 length:387 start_codon:yes stop_codon:yes gene_type:complete
MSLIQTNFIIASKYPKELANFYSKVNQNEVLKGFNDFHYLLPMGRGFYIQFYRPSKIENWPIQGRSVAICFQEKPSPAPMKKIEDWRANLIKLGAKTFSDPKIEFFGVEAWMNDPEGNAFLIVVPCFN